MAGSEEFRLKLESARDMVDAGVRYAEICTALDVSDSWLSKWFPQGRTEKNWTEQERATIIRMRGNGKSYACIAKKLGRSANAVRIKYHRERQRMLNDTKLTHVYHMLSWAHEKTGVDDIRKLMTACRKADLLNRYDWGDMNDRQQARN